MFKAIKVASMNAQSCEFDKGEGVEDALKYPSTRNACTTKGELAAATIQETTNATFELNCFLLEYKMNMKKENC